MIRDTLVLPSDSPAGWRASWILGNSTRNSDTAPEVSFILVRVQASNLFGSTEQTHLPLNILLQHLRIKHQEYSKKQLNIKGRIDKQFQNTIQLSDKGKTEVVYL